MADEEGNCPEPPQCEECPPEGAPAWMATFSDLVTLLLTFFVLLYAMSKQDVQKFQSVAGSIRKAFAGNAMKIGETIQLGKSPDDSPTMIESQEPVEPFPIDMLTTEGFLDKHEINRESDEDLNLMRKDLRVHNLEYSVNMQETKPGVKVRLKDHIFFKRGSTSIDNISVEVYQKLVNLMREGNWTLFIEGHAALGERGARGEDALDLSSKRVQAVLKNLMQKGVRPEKMTGVFYGDMRANKKDNFKKVEFTLRKRDLRSKGRPVGAQ